MKYMLTTVYSGATLGLSSLSVEVEVDIPKQGFPGFFIVGLPGKAVKEACERVRSAIKNSGYVFPNKRITVNLSPANLPKEGSAFDLPIALGILVADEQIKPAMSLHTCLVLGELSLDGSLRQTHGVLPLSLYARANGLKTVFLPADNAKEAAIISGIEVIPVTTLHEIGDHLGGKTTITSQPPTVISSEQEHLDSGFDMADVKGQEQAKRALEIAAAGGHNIMMMGPPGSGKTLLARTLPTILPEMTEDEILEVTNIYSVAGKLSSDTYAICSRPFRSPHHTTSTVGLIGGGTHPLPGEISLAHRGVLFLDEFLEFNRIILESLRQPLEDGNVTVSRAAGTVQFPAKFILVAAANPCPCGYLGSLKRHCTCLPGMVERYRKRLSGPILDRIDLYLTVPEVEVDKLDTTSPAEKSETIRARVNHARKQQIQRYKGKGIVCNAELTSKQVSLYCPLSTECRNLLSQATNRLGLSARSYFRIIKLARTIADLENSVTIELPHVAEALQYRPKVEENI